MDGPKRRAAIWVLIAVTVMLLYAVAYQQAMAMFENVEVSFFHALEIVVQSFTTTGYGEQSGQWQSTPMLLLVIAMQLTGVVLVFMTLPLFVVPLVESALSRTPPTSVDLEDHVVVCTYTPRGETLVAELESRDYDYVVVERDRETAMELYDDGYTVVHGDPESKASLEAAGIGDARALVADDDDETNASIILTARESRPDLRIVSVVEDPNVADYHRYAGADRVVSPRRLLGRRLAKKATTWVSTELGDAIEIGEDFEIAEMMVHGGCQVEGKTIAESHIGEMTGANVIGAWFRGEFVSPPSPDAVIDRNTVLLVAGRESQLEALKELTLSETRQHRRGRVVVAGFGEVGSAAASELAAADVPTTVIDLSEKPGVDVVGDVTEPQTLQEAGLEDARSVIMALDEDTTTIFATLVARRVAPGVEVIARANEAENTVKFYRAGAEYVLALATVSGRMLASTLLDEEVIAPDSQIELVRTRAPALEGRSLADAHVRARTNCTVIAVERNGSLLTDVGPNFVVQPEDTLVVAGVDEDINRFNELYDLGTTEGDAAD